MGYFEHLYKRDFKILEDPYGCFYFLQEYHYRREAGEHAFHVGWQTMRTWYGVRRKFHSIEKIYEFLEKTTKLPRSIYPEEPKTMGRVSYFDGKMVDCSGVLLLTVARETRRWIPEDKKEENEQKT